MLRVVTNGRKTPSVVSPNEIKSVMNEIAQKIPIDLQLGFESDFDIWHVYKYSVTMLILHDNEMHLIVKIPLADRDISISLVRIYDILVPLPEMGELQYPESKEFLLGLKSSSKLKTIIKHVFISAVSLISTIGFILALWQMCVFAFVWSGLKHCR